MAVDVVVIGAYKAEGLEVADFGRNVTSHTPLAYPFRIAYLVKK
ncbi:uncharacterized protein METZ01_LOCUS408160, partial [marine metagenome]